MQYGPVKAKLPSEILKNKPVPKEVQASGVTPTVIPKKLPDTGAEGFDRNTAKPVSSDFDWSSAQGQPSTAQNIAGGVVQGAAGIPQLAMTAGETVAKYDPSIKAIKGVASIIPGGKELINKLGGVIDKGKNFVNDKLDTAGADITGADPESTAFKISKGVTDIAQVAIPFLGEEKLLAEGGAMVAKGLPKVLPVIAEGLSKVLPKVSKVAIDEFVQAIPKRALKGLVDAQKYAGISEQRLATPAEMALGVGAEVAGPALLGGMKSTQGTKVTEGITQGTKQVKPMVPPTGTPGLSTDISEGRSIIKKALTDPKGLVRDFALDPKTLTALKTTAPSELDDYIRVTQEAVDDISKPTAYEHAAKKTEDAIKVIDKDMGSVGKQIGGIRTNVNEMKAGTEEVINTFNDALEQYGGIKLVPNMESKGLGILGPDGKEIASTVQNGYKMTFPNGVAKIVDSEVSLLNDFLGDLQAVEKNPTMGGLVNARQKISNMYRQLDKKSDQLGAIVDIFKDKISKTIESVAPAEYKPLLKQYSKYTKVMDAIDRLYGKEGERGSTMIRNMFGSNSQRTRELFTDIKKLTGIDLYKEGQLAKFVMESLGESRGLQAMMENLGEGKASLVKTGVKYIKDKIFNPIDAAKNVIKDNKAVVPKTNLPKPKATGKVKPKIK